MSTDTFEYVLDDLLEYCLEIEQLKDDICRYYKLQFPLLLVDPDYAEEYRDQHGPLLELNEERLITKQTILQALFSHYQLRLSINEKSHLMKRVEEALKPVSP